MFSSRKTVIRSITNYLDASGITIRISNGPRSFRSVVTMSQPKIEADKGTIVFVTGNQNKLREVKQILGESFPYKIVSREIDLPEYQGDPDQISRLKCQSAYEIVKAPVIVEDTCLGFNALGGLPGPYIKCFLNKVGQKGLFKMLQGFDDFSATAMGTFAYCAGDVNDIKLFKGIASGKIVSPRETEGFSGAVWNFQPDGYEQIYAEMSAEVKNSISHRKRAVEAMRDYFVLNRNN